jgi:hypothetical protein
MQRCSLPLAKLGCIQNDGLRDLTCRATRCIYAACKLRSDYTAPEPEPMVRPDDRMTDVISKGWDWAELRDLNPMEFIKLPCATT